MNPYLSPLQPPANLFLLMYGHRALSLHTHPVAVCPKQRVICQTGHTVSDKHTASIFVRKVNVFSGLPHCSLERGNVTEDHVLSRQPSTLAHTYQTRWRQKTAICDNLKCHSLVFLRRLTCCLCSTASNTSLAVNWLLGVQSKKGIHRTSQESLTE